MNARNDDDFYDVVIVGAGVAGATAAKTIADSGGKRILILEAGRSTGMSADKYQSHVLAFHEAMAKVPNSPYADNPNVPQPSELSLRQLVAPPPAPPAPPIVDDHGGYLVQTGPLAFASSYTRAFGGTTLHWLGTTLRMLPNDFRLKSTYDQGVDWPIEYEDLRPYYEKAETDIIGVAGNVEDQRYPGIGDDPNAYFHHDPNDPDSYDFPMERIPPSYVDQQLAERLDGCTVQLHDDDGGVTDHDIFVSSTPVGRNSTPRDGYEPVGAVGNPSEGHRCEGNSSCIPICPVQAKYNALKTLNEIRLNHPSRRTPDTGKSSVTTITQAVATKIEVDEHGLVSGITYKRYDDEASPNHTMHTVRGTIFVLAAHAVENAKLLLASGVGNSSGQVGRNLMDHPLILTWGLMKEKMWSYRGPGSTSGIPAFRDGPFRRHHSAFRVEIGNWGWSFAANAPYTTFETMVEGGSDEIAGTRAGRLFGSDLRQRMSEVLPRQFRLAWEMEQIPEASNFVSIDDNYRDALGNHRPVIHYDLPDYVRAGMEAARGASRQVFDRLGLQPLFDEDGQPVVNPDEFPVGYDYTDFVSPAARAKAGYLTYRGHGYVFDGAGHVAGTHRMGATKDMSVVDREQRSWDHRNLFMVGCGNMPTVGTSNPTLTMTALAIQAGEHIVEQLRKGH